MPEPVSMTLGAIAAAVVAKACEKGVERAAEGAVDGAEEGGSRVVAWLWSKLSRGDVLAKVEEVPDSPNRVMALAHVIDAEIVEPRDMDELRALLGQAKDQALYQSAIGDYNVQANNSTLNVNWPK